MVSIVLQVFGWHRSCLTECIYGYDSAVSWLGKKAEPRSHNPSNTDITFLLDVEPYRLHALYTGKRQAISLHKSTRSR